MNPVLSRSSPHKRSEHPSCLSFPIFQGQWLISTTASPSTHGTIRMPVFQVGKRSFRAETSCLHRRPSLEGVHSLTPRPDSGRQWWHGQTPTGPGHYERP